MEFRVLNDSDKNQYREELLEILSINEKASFRTWSTNGPHIHILDGFGFGELKNSQRPGRGHRYGVFLQKSGEINGTDLSG